MSPNTHGTLSIIFSFIKQHPKQNKALKQKREILIMFKRKIAEPVKLKVGNAVRYLLDSAYISQVFYAVN
jgi:hypothetical protein